jgi:hypothetical protein
LIGVLAFSIRLFSVSISPFHIISRSVYLFRLSASEFKAIDNRSIKPFRHLYINEQLIVYSCFFFVESQYQRRNCLYIYFSSDLKRMWFKNVDSSGVKVIFRLN